MPTFTLNERIEHTLLRADATLPEIARLCEEARQHRFFGVCVQPYWIADARQRLNGSGVKIVTAAGFPLGATLSRAKAFEARAAVEAGADEVDMVINLGAAKEGHWNFIEHEIHEIVSAAQGRPVKVILETAALTPEEITEGSLRAAAAGAHFVKTSTGFGPGGATPEAVALIHAAVGGRCGIKASGGIRDRATADRLLAAGATRLGTSASVALIAG